MSEKLELRHMHGVFGGREWVEDAAGVALQCTQTGLRRNTIKSIIIIRKRMRMISIKVIVVSDIIIGKEKEEHSEWSINNNGDSE